MCIRDSAYTGEVSAEMVKSTGAQYVIIGHSERRGYYNDTPEVLKEKVLLALKNGLKVIFCIGESLEEREANKQNEVVKAELEGSVFNLSAEEFKNIIVAYEPIWAIGTGDVYKRQLHGDALLQYSCWEPRCGFLSFPWQPYGGLSCRQEHGSCFSCLCRPEARRSDLPSA